MSDMQDLTVYLLSIQGVLAPATLEAARTVHNETAGAPANVAAARSLGDLSHMVYAPFHGHPPDNGKFLILDQWNRLDGLNQFFANHQVQEQAGLIFAQRDPVVWAPAEGLCQYHFPAPYGKNERILGIVRGPVRSQAEAQTVHNRLVAGAVNQARKAGNLSHEAYFRLAEPGSLNVLELFAVDVWTNADAMGEFYDSPEFGRGFQALFSAEPEASTWIHPHGEWVEW